MLSDASLAATSSRGAVKQNPNIKATPVRMRSVDMFEMALFVMETHKYIASGASILFATLGTGKGSVA